MNSHEVYMKRAIELAGNMPELPFGAVIVDQTHGDIAAEGWNRGGVSPIWHGEMDVIERLARSQPDADWAKMVLYTTAEPCPMCQSAILWAGIRTVVYGTSIPTLQRLGWWQIGIRSDEVCSRSPGKECQLIAGIMEAECDELFVRAKPA